MLSIGDQVSITMGPENNTTGPYIIVEIISAGEFPYDAINRASAYSRGAKYPFKNDTKSYVRYIVTPFAKTSISSLRIPRGEIKKIEKNVEAQQSIVFAGEDAIVIDGVHYRKFGTAYLSVDGNSNLFIKKL